MEAAVRDVRVSPEVRTAFAARWLVERRELIRTNRTAQLSRHIDQMALDIRYESLRALLALADPADLPPRRHHRTFEGELSRKDRIKWELAAAYVGHRMQMHAGEDEVVSVGRTPLRLVKKTA